MSVRLVYTTERIPTEAIPELSRVSLLRGVDVDAVGHLAAGSRGTIVSVYGEGEAYCVEFTDPIHALVTLGCRDLTAVPGDDREHLATASETVPD